MTVPTEATYSVAALVAAHTALLALIDGAATAGKVNIRDSADGLLATVMLSDPAGTVSGTTGRLTLSGPGGDLGLATGTPAYGEVCDGDGVAYLSLPVQSGSSAVSGYLVINTSTIIDGEPVTLVSGAIG